MTLPARQARDRQPPTRRPAPLSVICGPMFAGKTTELLRRIARARASGLDVMAIKPARDTRYSEMHLVAHTGERLEARRVAALEETLALVSTPAAHDPPGVEPKPHVIAIDEVHFFAEGAVEPIRRLRARGIHIVVAGCDLDHFGDVFAPFDRLLPAATEVVRLSGTCSRCGAPSTHSERLVAATDRIIVGGAAEFVATCARCFRPSRRDA